ncbi:MAG: hypothetical protein OXE99_04820 [Cellvibrionales bacterium]|nr:hypothetical protein [Cellvibrionales bacterium]
MKTTYQSNSSHRSYAVVHKQSQLVTDIVHGKIQKSTIHCKHIAETAISKIYPLSEQYLKEAYRLFDKPDCAKSQHALTHLALTGKPIDSGKGRPLRNVKSEKFKSDKQAAIDYVLAGGSYKTACTRFDVNLGSLRSWISKEKRLLA